MSYNQITVQTPGCPYKRLLVSDIRRMPKIKTGKTDTFAKQSPELIKKNKKKALIQQIFTLTTFGIVGLYIAHRKDLFNPIRREVKKLLKSTDFRNKIQEYVHENNTADLYQKTLKRYLDFLTKSKDKDAALKTEAEKILNDNSLFKSLKDEITKKINDEKITQENMIKNKLTSEEIENGFFYDLMEKIKVKLEKDLADNKKYNMPYKDRCQAWVNEQFTSTGSDNHKLIDELFLDVVQGRISDDVDKHINNNIINAKLQPKN